MYKVFINNFPIYLASANETINIKKAFVDINCDSKQDAKKIIHRHILANGEKSLVARNSDIEKLWKFFFDDYVPVKAAGGLVLNENDEMLFIFRNGKWDLPKGKIDPGEDEETAALREVNEECGLTGHQIESKILNTYHTYPFDHSLAIKTTAWFLMRVKNTDRLKPQLEEGITEVVWKSKKDFPEILKNTYGSIEDVLGNY
jgi:8-oxo-dGTP pyrophosphatase MutT (NUDIX family)